jgi:peroxiredoxin
MVNLIFGTVLPWVLVAVGAWLLYQLVRQNGRILLRLEAIEKHLGRRGGAPPRETPGLPFGSLTPDFELPDLTGKRHKLSEFRGRDVLLIFFNPQCGYCTKMAADVAALPFDGREGRPVPVVVSSGDLDENRRLVEQFGIRCPYLVQENMEIASRFHAQGTPMGYRIDKTGRVASPLAVGAEPLLQLFASETPSAGAQAPRKPHPHAKEPDPSLARSRLNRSGLKAGTAAPEFQLPRIDGGELSLSDLKGERILLVFSDPECSPCDELAPRLQELHTQRSDVRVLTVSRRDVEATRAKAKALGLTYPIVMQKQWELSMKYGMFATPIGYLIDEEGVLLSDVAVGIEPILALATPPSRAAALEPSQNGRHLAAAT